MKSDEAVGDVIDLDKTKGVEVETCLYEEELEW